MKKRVFIVHGWEDHPERGWFSWLQKQLEKRGFEVHAPKMPCQPPALKAWKAFLEGLVGVPDKDTYLVGHSAGCMTILRYLEGLPKGYQVGGAVLVAGWTDDLGFKELRNFFEKPVSWKDVRAHCRNFVVIYSDNDPHVKPYHAEVLEEELRANVMAEYGKGHLGGDDGVSELPSVLVELLKLAGAREQATLFSSACFR
ncbi:MAG: alpha/beta fold hydrolase [Candidatus Aenigmarchaeota archaeon]|nr:alpha/beta fold hydrolase [Candidatus Aenigmarchaeota archaeon]